MLDTLRQGASGWLAKLLMGLLVISFGVWGVRYSDTSSGTNTLLQVAGQNITSDQYKRLFDQEVTRLEQEAHQRIDPAIAHQLGVDQKIFTGLLVDGHARALNLGISDQALLDLLKSQKSLQSADGQLDPAALRFMLQQLRMTEESYFSMLRRDSVREQLLGSITGGAPAPAVLVEAFNQFESEQRAIDYFIVPVSKAPVQAKPDEAKLKAYFETHPEGYRAPEFRVLGVLYASPDDIKGTIMVSDDDAKGVYEANKATYVTPERRHVQMMSFQDKSAAEKAFAALKSGKEFMAVAKELGFADKDVDHGLIVKSDLLDKVVGEAAFKAEKDKVSNPIDGALTTSILRITEIQPGSTKTFDDAKAAIKDTRARELAAKQLVDYRAKIEDERGGGRALKDMPAKFPFKYLDLAPVDQAGVGVDGKPLPTTLPNLAALLKVGYAGDVGVEIEPVNLGKDGWAWVEVKEVKPARQKPLVEVKAEVERATIENETAAALAKLAGDLADRANKAEDFVKLAKEAGSEVKSVAGLTRKTKNAELPPAAVQLSFALAKGAAAAIGAADGKARLVFRLKDVTAAKPLEAAKAAETGKALTQRMAGGLESQYLSSLEQSLGFRLDEKLFKQMLGNGGDQTDQ